MGGYLLYIDGVLMPVTPGMMEVVVNGKNETATLINEGEINVLRLPGLSDINIPELLLPVHDYPFIASTNDGARGGTDPTEYLDLFERLKVNREHFIILLVDDRGEKAEDIRRMEVSLENYTILDDAEEHGDDTLVSLELKEYRNWGAKKLKVTGKTATTSSTSSRNKKNKIKKYKIKEKDTLKKIAKKYLYDSRLSKNIYSRNKKVIEAAAKKHGRKSSSKGKYLYAGTVITINLNDRYTGSNGIEDTDPKGGGGGF